MSAELATGGEVLWRQKVSAHLEAINVRTKRLSREEVPAWVLYPPAWLVDAVKQMNRIERLMASAMYARGADDDLWTRLPRPKARCPVSGLSRSAVMARIKEGAVRSKMVRGGRYYAAKDIAQLLNA